MMHSATAPAKIILVGEHAVVYGEPAIAVPVTGLSVKVHVKPAQQPGIHVQSVDTDDDLVYVGEDDEHPILHMIHLVLEMLHIGLPALTVRVESSVPVASGLGSGAAVSAALGRALGEALGQPFSTDKLNQIVYEVERLHHGTPSGIDNTVIVYEKPVFYIKDTNITFLKVGQPFKLLIADTGQQALTRLAVGDVRKLYDMQPETIQSIITSIGHLARRAASMIAAGRIEELGLIMNANHEFLQQLTVSSEALDRLVLSARDAGALGAKLSGGGRGGNMIALVTSETQMAVQSALLSAGSVNVYETIVS